VLGDAGLSVSLSGAEQEAEDGREPLPVSHAPRRAPTGSSPRRGTSRIPARPPLVYYVFADDVFGLLYVLYTIPRDVRERVEVVAAVWVT